MDDEKFVYIHSCKLSCLPGGKMSFQKIAVAGSGVLGSQIAFQIAYQGFDVVVYDINEKALASGKEKIESLAEVYSQEISQAEKEYREKAGHINYNHNLLPGLDEMFYFKVEKGIKRVNGLPSQILLTDNLELALTDADLMIEAIPEDIEIKERFYKKVAQVAPEKTIFATNSSTLLPSLFAKATGRPDRFLALHFANEIWRNNTAEVMGHAGTDKTVFNQVIQFAKEIGMVPLPLHKEYPGYILNTILVPFLEAAQKLLLHGVADPEAIDCTWRMATGAPLGPLQILDIVGIQTAYHILKNYADTAKDKNNIHAQLAKMLKEEYLDKGRTGKASGRGFYQY